MSMRKIVEKKHFLYTFDIFNTLFVHFFLFLISFCTLFLHSLITFSGFFCRIFVHFLCTFCTLFFNIVTTFCTPPKLVLQVFSNLLNFLSFCFVHFCTTFVFKISPLFCTKKYRKIYVKQKKDQNSYAVTL